MADTPIRASDERGRSRVPRVEESALLADLNRLSGGLVIDVPPSGPVFSPRQRTHREPRPTTFTAALPAGDRVVIGFLTVGWAAAIGLFWIWWPQADHRVTPFGTFVNSVLLLYLLSQPIYFIVAANRLRQVDPKLPVPELRVAFVVTRAPSEPWYVAETTLTAMLNQEFPYPYDVWLCDEKPEEHRKWCEDRGVRISSRDGVESYHRAEWPRRTRCKEGNLAYFYDHFGYENYDVVAQLDCDHVPAPTYLREMVRPFGDPAIGYVAAPSMCDANASGSWAARGRLHWEGSFHGPNQLGLNDGLAPVCIGSHYAVRTQALRDIGGIGPELAEDFSTSFLMNSADWHGVFAISAEAHGDGPLSFSDMVVQEFQWSRSLNIVLLQLAPRHIRRFGWWVRIRFLYCLLHYFALATVTICGLMLPPIAAVTGAAWMNVNYVEFLMRWWFVASWMIALAWFLRRRGLRRPADAPLVSWESWLYALARWPYIARGVFAAVVEQVRPTTFTIKVTPKTLDGVVPLRAVLIAPHVVVSLVMGLAAIVGELTWVSTVGYVFLCVLGSFMYMLVPFAVCILYAVETSQRVGVRFLHAVRETVPGALALSALTVPVAIANVALFPGYASWLLGWSY